MGVRGGAVGWGTALPARRSRVRLPIGSSGFFIEFRPLYGTGVDSASNRYEYQESLLGGKGGRCVGLTMLPPSFADCLEILRAPACNGIALALTLVDFVEESKSPRLLWPVCVCVCVRACARARACVCGRTALIWASYRFHLQGSRIQVLDRRSRIQGLGFVTRNVGKELPLLAA